MQMSKRAADLTTVGVLCGEGYFANYDDRLMLTIHVMICWPRRQLQTATAAVVRATLCFQLCLGEGNTRTARANKTLHR